FSSRRRHTRSKRDCSSDVCSSDLPLATAKSTLPSPLKSPTAMDDAPAAGKFCAAWKVPSPLPRSTETSPERRLATARSGLPSPRSEEHTSELQSRFDLVCRLLLEK